MVLASWLGVVLTLASLPGIWFMLLVAALCKWWQPDLLSWETLGAVALLAVVAEIAEFFSSAVGAAKTGGSRSAAWAAVVGAIIGAIAGTPFMPVVGTIAGAVIGAGLAATIVELGIHKKPWRESLKVGGGAAAGRLVAVVIKGVLALACATILTIAALA
ncbi:MAG: DUF456 domain-containing protein [Planctomycetes bacterium]|nr:DUF456 domain-containing protein [Planctomycetota bacterium]